MKLQHGGLKLITNGVNGIHVMIEMIENGNLQFFADGSLYGFMTTIQTTVPKYIALSGRGFTKQVTSYLVKFVMVNQISTKIDDYIRYPVTSPATQKTKGVLTKEDFLDECSLQQEVWFTSITGGRPEICPSIAMWDVLENDRAIEFTNYLLTLPAENVDEGSKHVFRFLMSFLNHSRTTSIGVLLMENKQSDTLFDFVYKYKNVGSNGYGLDLTPNPLILSAYAAALAQTSRLALEENVISLDSHMDNMLIFIKQNVVHALEIDFGRALIFKLKNTNNYKIIGFPANKITPAEVNDLQTNMEKYYEILFYVKEGEEVNFMRSVLFYICKVDEKFTKKMKWILYLISYKEDDADSYVKKAILTEAFKIIKKSMIVENPRANASSLKKKVKEGAIQVESLNTKRRVNKTNETQKQSRSEGFASRRYYVEPSNAPECDPKPSNNFCAIMGGKRKKKGIKGKINKKTKKQKRKYCKKNLHQEKMR